MASKPRPNPVGSVGATASGTAPDYLIRQITDILYLTLLDNDEGEQALAQVKELSLDNRVEASLAARRLISHVLGRLLKDDALRPIISKLDDVQSSIAAVSQNLEQLRESHPGDFLSVLMPQGILRERYNSDHPREKAQLADYAVRTFLGLGPVSCFVQASTTAIHLGNALNGSAKLASGSLFYTNSVVLPLILLRERCPFSVYTFCGPHYDPLCGGWLFAPSDKTTSDHLRELFRRDRGRLTTAVLTPIATTVEDGPCFLRDDTAGLAHILLEEAEHVIILTTADRVALRQPAPPASFPALDQGWASVTGRRVTVVLNGMPSFGDLFEFAEAFREKGLDVHWLDSKSRQWLRCQQPGAVKSSHTERPGTWIPEQGYLRRFTVMGSESSLSREATNTGTPASQAPSPAELSGDEQAHLYLGAGPLKPICSQSHEVGRGAPSTGPGAMLETVVTPESQLPEPRASGVRKDSLTDSAVPGYRTFIPSHPVCTPEQAGAVPIKEESPMDKDVRALIDLSITTFHHDFSSLMREHGGQWVVYRGDERVGVGASKLDVLRIGHDRGYADRELYVAKIQEDLPVAYASWEEG